MVQVPVVAVSGVKNSGKTTLLCGLIPILKNKGLRPAVIKHDGHDYHPDPPGTDSCRLREAGACQVAVYSPRRFSLAVDRPGATVETLLAHFEAVDLVLLEGGKDSAWPKIEVVRGAVSRAPVGRPETLWAVVTDLGLDRAWPGVPVVGLGDYEELADLILRRLQAAGLRG
ncbi:MAG: molybdopterin-guanine dinucleotide biosynthesis protein B [Candidatus Adiutrix sp.]|jgi:molybdopterin-guanine dinucleotide biosynthesis protein B|nr:molybdopterin-guanine dinucleotide biosynthesis protein B [Candidatus Adiutrix sp.]